MSNQGGFEMAFLKFQQDLQTLTEVQKDKDCLSQMDKGQLVEEIVSLYGDIDSLNDIFCIVQGEKGKVDESFASFKKSLKLSDESQPEAYAFVLKTVQDLEKDVKRLGQYESGNCEESVSTLTQFSSMDTALKQSQEREAELQQEVVSAQKKISALEHNIQITMEKLETAERSLRRSEKEVVSLKEDLLVFKKKIAEKDEQVLEFRKEKALMQKEIEELKGNISVYRGELSEKDGDNKRLRATIADKQSIMESYVTQITRMKEEASSGVFSNKDYELLKLKCDEVCKERDSLQREVARLTAKRQTDVSIQLDSQAEGYRRQIRDKDDTIERLRTESMSLHVENDSLKKERALSSASQYQRQEYDSMKTRYDALWSEKECIKKELEVYKARPRTISVDVESCLQEIREKEITIDRMRSENITLQAQIEALKRESANVSSSSEYTMRVHSSCVQLEGNEDFYRQEIKERDAVIDKLRSETMTLHAEIDGLKRDMRSYYSRVDYEALQMKYDEIVRDRDLLRGELIDVKSRNEREASIHVESRVEGYQQDIRDKEILIDKLRAEKMAVENELEVLKRDVSGRNSVTDGYLAEIERLRQQIISLQTGAADYESLKRTYEEVVKERDFVRTQLLEFRSHSEHELSTHIDSYSEAFRQDIREKEMAIDRLRTENTNLRAELDGLKREMSTLYNRTEYESLKLQYGEIWKERDLLREQLIDIKSKTDREVLIQVESKTQVFQKEIREKEMECAKLRSETITIQMTVDGLRRDLESKQFYIEGYQSEIERLKSEITTLKSTTVTTTEFESLRRNYDETIKERDAIRLELVEVKSNSEREVYTQVDNQVRIYREETREKEILISTLRSESMKFQSEVDLLKREVENKQYLIDGFVAEIDRLKKEIVVINKTVLEYDSLKRSYDSICREKDYADRQLTEFKSRSEHETSIQIEVQTDSLRHEVREKDNVIERLRSQSKMLMEEVESLKRERSSFYSKSEYDSLKLQYEEIWKERDSLRLQLSEVKAKSEREVLVQVESRVETYKTDIREKETVISRLQSDNLKYKSEVESLKWQIGNQERYLIEIDLLKKEVNTLRFPDIRNSAEFLSLQRSYEEVCKERDGLRGQIIEVRMKTEQTAENQVRVYREEIREKEVTIEGFRSEIMTLRAEIEGLKRQLGNQEGYLIEIDRLKKEVNTLRFPDIRNSAEFLSLQRSYEEVCKERDGLRGQIIEVRMKTEQTAENQVRVYREEIREKEVTIEGFRSEIMTLRAEIEGLKRQLGNQEGYLIEIDRLKKEVNTLRFPDIRNSAKFLSLQRSYEEVCKERDGLRGQIIEVRMKTEQTAENQVRVYREEFREKEVAIESFRSEIMTLRAEIEGLKRELTTSQHRSQIEIERVRKESSVVSSSIIRNSAEFVSLQRSYEEICKERDALRQQMVEIRTKSESELTIQIDNQVRVYCEELREKEIALERLRLETITLKAELETVKGELASTKTSRESYALEIERLKKDITINLSSYESLKLKHDELSKEKDRLMSINCTLERDLRVAKETPVYDVKMEQELFNLRAKFAKLQEDYNALIVTKNKMEEEIVMKVNSGIADKQDYIYKLEKEIRELKSTNEYYEKTVDEKNTAIGDLRLKVTELQRQIEALKKEVYIAEEAYEKAELRLKEVLKSEYKPVTTYEIRRYRTTSVGKDANDAAANADYSMSKSTLAATTTTSDADALHFSATSTPVSIQKRSVIKEEREGSDYASTLKSAPLDNDLARAEGTYQSTTTTKSMLIDGVASSASRATSEASMKGSAFRSSVYVPHSIGAERKSSYYRHTSYQVPGSRKHSAYSYRSLTYRPKFY